MGKRLGIFDGSDPASQSWQATAAGVNPFDKNILAAQKITTTVTSIPSPYARMHLFEVAFRQLSDGAEGVSDEMKRCAAHCLDVYELLFHLKTGEALRKNGLHIDLHRYKDVSEAKPGSIEYKYLDALCTFRNSYARRYNDNSLFKVFFTLSKGQSLIAATSPFTGFYVKTDPEQVHIGQRIYFAKDQKDVAGNNQWLGLDERDEDVQEFIYKLIRFLVNRPGTSFADRYADFWKYVDAKVSADNKAKWSKEDFASTYAEFDFAAFGTGDYGFPIFTENPAWNNLQGDQKIYVIPSEYDSCALRYMIAPEESANFRLAPSDYVQDIMARKNPINKQPLAWVSVDDFLDDTLNIIQGEINNEAYFCVRNEDDTPDKGAEYQVLPPLKKRFFEFFRVQDLQPQGTAAPRVQFSLRHKQNEDGETTCLFTIKVPYYKDENVGGQIVRNVYYLSLSKEYDNQHCRTSVGLELGIYPFFKTPANVDDFYRVACYASNSMGCTDLELIRLTGGFATNAEVLQSDGNYVKKSNGNSDIVTALNSKIFYYALDGTFYTSSKGILPHKDVSFDLLNLKYNIERPGGNISKEQLIVPLMKTVAQNKGDINIAIDLGTSNTYVCYAYGTNAPVPFETLNSNIGNVQFVKLGKVVGESATAPTKDKYDMDGLYRLTQRCELMPAYFADAPDGYHFPVPTVLNTKDTTGSQLKDYETAPLSTLFDVNIPFSYFEDGTRTFSGNPIDNVCSNFKWFKLNEGDEKKAQVTLYAEQLCLMLRSNLLARERSLDSVKLYFTYPLSFSENQTPFFESMWKRIYAKYFNKTADANFMSSPKTNIDSIQEVTCDAESRTPLFSDPALLVTNPNVISADIGGGSTDVMLFDSTKPTPKEMCFSFKFAGNSLFCGEVLLNKQNVWYTEILKNILPQKLTVVASGLTQKKAAADDNERDVIDLMNKCFSDNSLNQKVIEQLSGAVGCSLLLTLHNSAIIYAMADLCRLYNINGRWIPSDAFFSGNGSRMLFLNMAKNAQTNDQVMLEEVTRTIFGEIMPDLKATFGGVNITKSKEPKAATAKGVLMGIAAGKTIGAKNVEHYVAYGEEDGTLYKVPLIRNRPNADGMPIPKKKQEFVEDFSGERKIYNSVIANVKHFLNIYFKEIIPMFANLDNEFTYDETCKEEKIGTKRNIYYYLAVSNRSFEVGYQAGLSALDTEFKESLFFAVMTQIIQDLCKSLAKSK